MAFSSSTKKAVIVVASAAALGNASGSSGAALALQMQNASIPDEVVMELAIINAKGRRPALRKPATGKAAITPKTAIAKPQCKNVAQGTREEQHGEEQKEQTSSEADPGLRHSLYKRVHMTADEVAHMMPDGQGQGSQQASEQVEMEDDGPMAKMMNYVNARLKDEAGSVEEGEDHVVTDLDLGIAQQTLNASRHNMVKATIINATSGGKKNAPGDEIFSGKMFPGRPRRAAQKNRPALCHSLYQAVNQTPVEVDRISLAAKLQAESQGSKIRAQLKKNLEDKKNWKAEETMTELKPELDLKNKLAVSDFLQPV
jgi:hypothetical protein